MHYSFIYNMQMTPQNMFFLTSTLFYFFLSTAMKCYRILVALSCIGLWYLKLVRFVFTTSMGILSSGMFASCCLQHSRIQKLCIENYLVLLSSGAHLMQGVWLTVSTVRSLFFQLLLSPEYYMVTHIIGNFRNKS